jgi:hypothetical protein
LRSKAELCPSTSAGYDADSGRRNRKRHAGLTALHSELSGYPAAEPGATVDPGLSPTSDSETSAGQGLSIPRSWRTLRMYG